jgi:hypothetical protein
MSDWQPIETAPKDGDFLIAMSDGEVRVGYFLDNSHTKFPYKGVRPRYGVDRVGVKPAYWGPLPPPPDTPKRPA